MKLPQFVKKKRKKKNSKPPIFFPTSNNFFKFFLGPKNSKNQPSRSRPVPNCPRPPPPRFFVCKTFLNWSPTPRAKNQKKSPSPPRPRVSGRAKKNLFKIWFWGGKRQEKKKPTPFWEKPNLILEKLESGKRPRLKSPP